MSGNGIAHVVTKERIAKAIANHLNTDCFVLGDIKYSTRSNEVSGFMGAHWRVQAVVQQNGTEKLCIFFVKSFPLQESQRAAVIDTGAFEREVNFYNQLLPELMKQGIPLPYPKCYFAYSDGRNDFLILEDLKRNNFRQAKMLMKGLDLLHCGLAIRELAMLHAASVALEKRKGKPLNEIYPFLSEVMFSDPCVKLFKDGFKTSAETILELVKLIPRHKKSIPVLEAKMKNLHAEGCKLVQQWDVLNVVCHGDVWTNNMLFKYSDGKPVTVKLLDLQFARYGPPTLDIILFFFVSTTRSFREKYQMFLLEFYYRYFMNAIQHLGISLPQFTLEALQKNFMSKRLLGTIYALWSLPFILLQQEQLTRAIDPGTPDEFESLRKGKMTNIAVHMFQQDPKYRQRLSEVIDEIFEVFSIE